MRILHIAPHYGGGIAPAVGGIFESIKGSHYLIEIEKTKDVLSISFLKTNNISTECLKDFTYKDEILFDTDLIILHYWDTTVWSKLT